MTPNPDPLRPEDVPHFSLQGSLGGDPTPPPRRSGCLSVLSLALLLAIALGIAPSDVQSAQTPTVVVETAYTKLAGRSGAADQPDEVYWFESSRGSASEPSGSVGTALLGGWISWADPDLGGDYLATRFPRGTLVRLCTPNRCIVRRSNDFGPSAKIDPPRIADLAVLDWESLCGLPRARGVCRGTVEAIDDLPLPPTDSEETP